MATYQTAVAVGGVRGTGNWGEDERPRDFRNMILWTQPEGDTPIFALMGRAKKKSVSDPEFHWWAEKKDIVQLQLNGAPGAGTPGSNQTLTVHGVDPDSDYAATYGSALHLKAGDVLLVQGTLQNTFAAEHVRVATTPTSATSVEVTRDVTGVGTAPDIPDGTTLLLIGSAYAEGTRSPDAASRNPQKWYNYTQIFKDTYEVTGTAEKTETRTGDPIKNDKLRKSFDHARGYELALLYGRKSETVGTNGKPMRYMGGLREFIPSTHQTIFPGTPQSEQDFIDACRPAYDWSTPAGDSRILFGGNGMAVALAKMARNSAGHGRVNFGEKVTMYGMRLKEIELPFGTIYFKRHPLLSRDSTMTNSGFLVDFSCLEYKYLRGRDTRAKDNVQHNDEDTRKGQWLTEASCLVDQGGLSMAFIHNFKYDDVGIAGAAVAQGAGTNSMQAELEALKAKVAAMGKK